MSMFNPYNSFWVAEDGRVYGSAAQAITTDADPDYLAFVENGFLPLEWARELDGSQTDAAMQAVLASYGMFLDLKYYTIDKRWRTEQGGTTSTAGFPIRTDDRSQAKITGLFTASVEDPTVVTTYQASDQTLHEIDAAGILQLHVDLLTYINACFAVSANTLGQIDAGTITTREQVDAMFGDVMTQANKNWLKVKNR